MNLRPYLFRAATLVLPVLACSFNAQAALTVLDLSTAGASATGTAVVGGSFRVDQISPQSTGTGVIDPFLRVQANGEQAGYNTNITPAPLDSKAGIWTHAITLGDIPTVIIGGVVYRQFMLDINQNTGGGAGATNNLLSLNNVAIFTRAGDALHTSYTAAAGSTEANIGFSSATKVFDMSGLGADKNTAGNEVKLNFDLNPGSGAGDMFLYVRDSVFAGASASTNVIFFSQFGTPPGSFQTNDGFEEWALLKSTAVIPEPSSVVLFGTVLLGVGVWLRRRVGVNV